ncbi:hypothetical protein K469DRAFT_711470, partial [Zopfia rhizophila CBS 207.26]
RACPSPSAFCLLLHISSPPTALPFPTPHQHTHVASTLHNPSNSIPDTNTLS